MKASYPLLVIGAGPAGMAAAQAAAEQGVEVALVDEQPRPGGQIYRDAGSGPLADPELLGKDYAFGRQSIRNFRRSGAAYFPCTAVWYLDRERNLGVLHHGAHRRLRAERIIIACGAQERPMPFPGWQLPGVMTAGAAQILLKSAALVPDESPVLAGSGPLLLLLAWQYLRAGIGIRALVDTTPAGSLWPALRYLPRALLAGDYLFKGMQLVAAIRRARIPWYRQASELRADGEERLAGLRFRARGRQHEIETRLLLVHQGVIPALQVASAAGCESEWNPYQQCWQAVVDRWGESSEAGIFVAGDGAAIGGARAAALAGQLAGLQAARQLGLLEPARRDRLAGPIRKAQLRHLSLRPFLDRYYRLDEVALQPDDDTLLCRCEEIGAAQIRAVARLGCSGPNQAKAFTRCGMGPCQGRFCGSGVEWILARQQAVGVDRIGRYNSRPPLQPVTLGQLAISEGEQR
ncbi:MAG: NAD(P)/FAD-dependent oxidoreductase [Gammaproteobacteria bacterium]